MQQQEPNRYFDTRLMQDQRRQVLWKTLCQYAFSRYIPESGAIVELGAAYCDFINNVVAERRIAVDVWPGVSKFAEDAVEAHVGQAYDLSFLDGDSVDVVFASNLVEHLVISEARALLREARRVLRRKGRLILLQPNYRLSYKRYFDDYTHVSIWSDVSLSDFLVTEGFDIERLEPRFLPLTVKSRLPIHPLLIRAYLRSPIKPMAGQMLAVARPG